MSLPTAIDESNSLIDGSRRLTHEQKSLIAAPASPMHASPRPIGPQRPHHCGRGADRWTDAEDDRLIGGLWANLSDGRCRFVMVRDKRWDWIEAQLDG